jgi:hypothetical protein
MAYINAAVRILMLLGSISATPAAASTLDGARNVQITATHRS